MTDQPNKLVRLWQELKRRNVIRVITVYAATAFVILELVDILAPSLGLPAWTLNLVLVLLFVGLVIAIIVSWIYDFHPLGGIVKTEPAEKTKDIDTPRFSNSWKIASIISFVVIIGLIILHIVPRSGATRNLEKSIAVLPFINDSPEEEGMYFLNGSMESILDNLSRIQDLRVVSRTSVEQYRNNPKPIPQIAQEMNVAYILEGSGLKHGDRIRLTLQLIDAQHDTHVWSDSYDRRDHDVFDLYSEVAQKVASAIEAIITPEEQQRIDKIPTSSTTAFDLFRKAAEVSDEQRMELLNLALEYDSTFSGPYIELGWMYLNRYEINPQQFPEFLDSAARMSAKALHFDPQSARAYSLSGYILRQEGKFDEALQSFDRALQLNPNLAEAYNGKGWIYFGEMDYVNALDNFSQNILRDRTSANLGNIYQSIAFVLANVGMKELATQNFHKAMEYTGDSTWYYIKKAQSEFYARNYTEAITTANQKYRESLLSATVERNFHIYGMAVLGESHMFVNQYPEAYTYFNRYVKFVDSVGYSLPWHKMEIAYIFRKNGREETARVLIDQQIRQSKQWIAESHNYINDELLHLAMAYMLEQDQEKALMYLDQLSQKERLNAIAAMIPANPIFSPLNDDPEFVEICDRIQVRYQAEQDRVRQWLAENDLQL